MTGKLIIFSAPSGSGKSTIINYLMTQGLNLAFSISATSRAPRGTEQHGVEYYFLSPEEFKQRIANNEFLEYEEVYENRFYGTLKAPIEKQLEEGYNVVFDVDVVGGCNIKNTTGTEPYPSLSNRRALKNSANGSSVGVPTPWRLLKTESPKRNLNWDSPINSTL